MLLQKNTFATIRPGKLIEIIFPFNKSSFAMKNLMPFHDGCITFLEIQYRKYKVMLRCDCHQIICHVLGYMDHAILLTKENLV